MLSPKPIYALLAVLLALFVGWFGASEYLANQDGAPRDFGQEAVERRQQVGLILKQGENPLDSVDCPVEILPEEAVSNGPVEMRETAAEGWADWSTQWRDKPPTYKKETVISVYSVDPTGYRAWQIGNPEDARVLITMIETELIEAAPTHGMDAGLAIVTDKGRYYAYLTEAADSPHGMDLRQTIGEIRQRGLETVDVFLMLNPAQIATLSFNGFAQDGEGKMNRYSLKTEDPAALEASLEALRRIRVLGVESIPPEDPSFVAGDGSGCYEITMELKGSYEGTIIHLVGYPQKVMVWFSLRGQSVLVYQVEAGYSQLFWDEMKMVEGVSFEKIEANAFADGLLTP